MSAFTITRDANRCVACLECIVVCPQSSEGRSDSVIVKAANPDDPPIINCINNCLQCMSCYDFCRANAIIFNDYHSVEILAKNTKAHEKAAKIV